MKQSDVAKLVTMFAAAYPGWTPTAETVTVWCAALSDLDRDLARLVASEIISTDSRWPTIAEFRRRYASHAGVLAPTPAEAWAEVQRAASTHGRHEVISWSHPAIAQAVAAIGWWQLCMSENPDTVRAQWRRAYEEFAASMDRAGVISMEAPDTVDARALEPPEIINMRRSMQAAAIRDLEVVNPTPPPAALKLAARTMTATPDPWREACEARAVKVTTPHEPTTAE